MLYCLFLFSFLFREAPVLDLLWAIIRPLLLSEINLQVHPELQVLSTSSSTTPTASLDEVDSEELLLMWLNHHLRESLESGGGSVNHEPIGDLRTGLNVSLV